MKIAGVLFALAVMYGCGADGDSGGSELHVTDEGTFSGCIDSGLFSPQECHYTCEDNKAFGYKIDTQFCQQRGSAGDIACFCP